ncbi:hypothetical protein [uncultured Nonlabens sp.]|nr:hypothetical protein [uncultured Nonlabens sp.]
MKLRKTLKIVLYSLTGFFLLAISQIIQKAEYYKIQNDLTI